MLENIKSNFISLLDSSLFTFHQYQAKLEQGTAKDNDFLISYHIFAAEVLDIIKNADELTEKCATLVIKYDEENNYEARDAMSALSDLCLEFRTSLESFLRESANTIKEPAYAKKSLLSGIAVLFKKLSLLKNTLKD